MLRFKKTVASETWKTSQPMKLPKIVTNLGRAEKLWKIQEDCGEKKTIFFSPS